MAKTESVRIKLFKDGGDYRDDVFVAVNGHDFLIRRGVEVEVPAYIAEALDNSRVAQEEADRRMGAESRYQYE